MPEENHIPHGYTVRAENASGVAIGDNAQVIQNIAAVYNIQPAAAGQSRITAGLKLDLGVLLARHAVFGGREQALVELNTFVATQPGGYFFVSGPSGYGKSALLAHWIHELEALNLPVCYHFISRSDDAAGEQVTLADLCEQLAVRHDLGGTLTEAVDRLRNLYPKLLALSPFDLPSAKLVVVIDGLDEATGWEPRGVHFPAELPDGVYIVFSARSIANQDWPAQLGLTGRTETLLLDTLGTREIAGLLQSAGGRAAALAGNRAFVDAVTTVSRGDPFYLHFMVQDILDGDITQQNIKDQPQGLTAYFDAWWEQLGQDVDIAKEEVYDLLGLLAVAQGRLLPQDFAGISPNLRKGALLKKELGGKLRRYLAGDVTHGYSIAHPRFGDYLRTTAFFDNEIDAYLDQVLAYAADWRTHKSRYALTYYARHLAQAAGRRQGSKRHDLIARLVELTTDDEFQTLYRTEIGDLTRLQADLVRGLDAAASDEHPAAPPLVVRSALNLDAFRRRELRPELIFDLARAGNIPGALQALDLFDAEGDWRQATQLIIAWLAADSNPAGAAALRATLQGLSQAAEPLPALAQWVDHALAGAPPPPMMSSSGVNPEKVRAIVARMGGTGDVELLAQHELLHGMASPELTGGINFLAEKDAPVLVDLAISQPDLGTAYLTEYVHLHTGYDYAYYRGRSLWELEKWIVRHPQADWVRDMTASLAASALAGSRSDFRQGLPDTLVALRTRRTGDAGPWQTVLDRTLDEVVQRGLGSAALPPPDCLPGDPPLGPGDTTNAYRRRLASQAEAAARVLDRPDIAAERLQRAACVAYGAAGYGLTAFLTLAEALRVCRPGDLVARQRALDAALRAAHNIQEATFCIRSTARVRALSLAWSQPFDVRTAAARLRHEPAHPDFAAVHVVGEDFAGRAPAGRLPLPPMLYGAASLSEVAQIHRRPLREVQRLNPQWQADEPLPPCSLVRLPDPGFATLLAARCAAEALVDTTLAPAERVLLIQSLVPVAAANATALDTVLSRLLLADPPAAATLADDLEAAWASQRLPPDNEPPNLNLLARGIPA